ncbi:MAG TPA: SAM-dependent methyltransferase [Chlamydiales bacterium]|jgi:16S rRNA (cytidine1402-2'-O)-methyltransferase|nr:SAM-dependent methyltransferase [Chlamydiales bacterium]
MSIEAPGKLILLPNLLDENGPWEQFLPAGVNRAVHSIQGLIVESEKSGRRYLRKFLSHEEMAAMPLRLLNEHTKELAALIEPMVKGETWGLISDAGLSCLADPGTDLVALAHSKGIAVDTYAGPSSIIFALQLSGFSGQKFTFHGYLPRESPQIEQAIRDLEKRAKAETQIFIEAPYRSAKLLNLLLTVLQPNTRLCVAASLTTPQQRVLSQTVAKWKQTQFSLEKEPVVFLIQ